MSRVIQTQDASRLLRTSQDVANYLLEKVAHGTKGLIGTEIELFVTDAAGKPATFTQIEKVLAHIAGQFDDAQVRTEAGRIVGVHVPQAGDVCLEPGGQVELATKPCQDMSELALVNHALRHALRQAANEQNLQVTGTGHMPAFIEAEDMPRSRFGAYYKYCRAEKGAPAQDLIDTMKSVCGLQINLDPMGDDFHEVYKALMLLDLAHSFAGLTDRQKRLEKTYANLFPEQVTPMFNAVAAKDNGALVAQIVERLLTLKVPFVPDETSAEGFKSTRDVFGHAPTIGALMEKGVLTTGLLDNCLSLQMTMPNLRRHGVLETRAPDSTQLVAGLLDTARLYKAYAYDAKARSALVQGFAGVEPDKLEKAFKARFDVPRETLAQMDIGAGKTVADLVALTVPKPAVAPVRKLKV